MYIAKNPQTGNWLLICPTPSLLYYCEDKLTGEFSKKNAAMRKMKRHYVQEIVHMGP